MITLATLYNDDGGKDDDDDNVEIAFLFATLNENGVEFENQVLYVVRQNILMCSQILFDVTKELIL